MKKPKLTPDGDKKPLDWRWICAGIFCIATGFLLPLGVAFMFLGIYPSFTSNYLKKNQGNITNYPGSKA